VALLGGIPLLSKPRVGRGGRGVIMHRPDEPAEAFGTDDRIVQEYVPGQEYAVNVYLCASPGCDVAQALEKTELSGGTVGNAVAVRLVDEPRIARLASYAVLALGLRGPADVDIRLRSDGSPVVLEVNARFGAHSARSPALLDTLLAERLAGTR
jgi:predicted ATP-grasp superfamily ATP-dependent carboligase